MFIVVIDTNENVKIVKINPWIFVAEPLETVTWISWKKQQKKTATLVMTVEWPLRCGQPLKVTWKHSDFWLPEGMYLSFC